MIFQNNIQFIVSPILLINDDNIAICRFEISVSENDHKNNEDLTSEMVLQIINCKLDEVFVPDSIIYPQYKRKNRFNLNFYGRKVLYSYTQNGILPKKLTELFRIYLDKYADQRRLRDVIFFSRYNCSIPFPVTKIENFKKLVYRGNYFLGQDELHSDYKKIDNGTYINVLSSTNSVVLKGKKTDKIRCTILDCTIIELFLFTKKMYLEAKNDSDNRNFLKLRRQLHKFQFDLNQGTTLSKLFYYPFTTLKEIMGIDKMIEDTDKLILLSSNIAEYEKSQRQQRQNKLIAVLAMLLSGEAILTYILLPFFCFLFKKDANQVSDLVRGIIFILPALVASVVVISFDRKK